MPVQKVGQKAIDTYLVKKSQLLLKLLFIN